MGSGEWGEERGCGVEVWEGGSRRWSRQARARGREVKSEIGEGEMCVRVEMGSKGQWEGAGEWGLGRRINLSDNCSNFMSHHLNRHFNAI